MEIPQFHQIDTKEKVASLWLSNQNRPQLLFKHSFRCGISAGALYGLEPFLKEIQAMVDLHFIDVVAYREFSLAIANEFKVMHQSPQVIIWQNQKIIYQASHSAIRGDVILQKLRMVL